MKTKTKFLGSNGKKGVTVYKPIDLDTLSKGIKKMNKDNTSKIKIVNDDGVMYKITKKEIKKNEKKKILSKPNSLLNFQKYSELSKRGYLDWKNSYQLKTEKLRRLSGDIYNITKKNKNGKKFKFYIINSNFGSLVRGNLLKHKIKMRMY